MSEDTPNATPRITLKLATSLDGKIATGTGHSQWITSPQSRAEVHKLRAEHDGVITGIGTVLADDPELTARTDPPAPRQPARIVLDTHGRLPRASKLMTSQDKAALYVFHEHGTKPIAPDVTHFVAPSPTGEGLNLSEVLHILHGLGLRSVMVEAGARLAGSFLRAGLVDQIEWFRAPMMIGGDGLDVVASLGITALSQAPMLKRVDIVPCGPDVWERYAR